MRRHRLVSRRIGEQAPGEGYCASSLGEAVRLPRVRSRLLSAAHAKSYSLLCTSLCPRGAELLPITAMPRGMSPPLAFDQYYQAAFWPVNIHFVVRITNSCMYSNREQRGSSRLRPGHTCHQAQPLHTYKSRRNAVCDYLRKRLWHERQAEPVYESKGGPRLPEI